MKTLYAWLKTVAKFINFSRLFILNCLFLVIIIAIISAINIEEPQVIVSDNSTLHLNFSGSIVEQKKPIDFSAELSKQLVTSTEKINNEYQIDEILQVIRYAKYDPKIDNILLELDGLTHASINHLNDIGDALNNFKSVGKKVTATADNYSQSQYFLASFADQINLNPQGMVFLQGYSVYRLYFKDALDKLLITPHIFKVGTYKSFVEPFTQNAMSEASKQANKRWLQQLWKNYSDTVIAQRQASNLSAESLSPTLTKLKNDLQKVDGDPARYALQAGLVDALSPRFTVVNEMEKQAQSQGHEFTLVSYDAYQSTLPPLYQDQYSQQQIALIHGSGEILSGEQQNGDAIGGDSFSKLLEKALIDTKIKAVVIRLDTPGGSAFASEKIRQQILALKQADKKVVISMGSVAASGGYWIASAADKIIAHPTTLTGSIGIFGMFASIDKALNKFGIYNDGIGTNELSTINPTRALNPELAEIMQLGIEHGYKQFLNVVAEGRNMSLAEVDKIAQGRVWTGEDAKQYGLVDQLGNLQDAINEAATLANINEYQIKIIGPTLSTKQQLLNEMFTASIKLLPQSVQISPSLYQALQSIQDQTSILSRFNDPQGHYLYCPMCSVK